MAMDAVIDRAIESYQLSWRAQSGQLGRLVVAVDPVQHGPARRREDQIALMAAEHLFHLIREGGGVPALTRADDRPMPRLELGVERALIEHCRASRCHLLLRIEVRTEAAKTTVPTGADDLSRELAAAFASTTTAVPLEIAHDACRVPGALLTFIAPPPSDDPLADRLFHRRIAETIFAGLAQFEDSHREALNIARESRWRDCATAASQPVPLYPTATREERRGRTSRAIWSDGPLPPEKAGWFAEMFRRTLSDRTIFYFEPQVTVEGSRVVLGGATTDHQVTEGLLRSLEVVGINAEDRMRVLPDELALGSRLYGVCISPSARTFAQPNESTGPQTQLTYGEPLFLLDAQGDYLLVQAGDGYWGWVRRADVKTLSRDEFKAYTAAPFGLLTRERPAGDLLLRRGSRLAVEPGADGTVRARLVDGQVLELGRDTDIEIIDTTAESYRRVHAALELLYTPYVYGGRSTTGLDCSGLVASVAELSGLAPARDAAQQCLSGRLVATRWHREGMRAGDQIYFIDESGKIFHTGIMLNETHFVHCSPPEVQISSLRKGDRLYNPHWDETFFCVKRH